MRTNINRSRWAAVGAAIAVALGAGGLGVVSATISSGSRAVFVPITPCRLVDTRPTTPLGPASTTTYNVHGTNGACTIPAGATAISGNATITDPTDDGFMTIAPKGGIGTASNLNWLRGQSPTPNAFTVALSADGRIDVYNDRGTVNVIIDINGYYEDHHHDDRYYTEAQTDAALGTKANTADVYTKAQTDALVAASNEPVVISSSASGTTLPPIDGSLGSQTFTTTKAAHLEIHHLVRGGAECASTSFVVFWLELDGVPIRSSIFTELEIDTTAGTETFTANRFPSRTMMGVTESQVPAGQHTVVTRFACLSGATDVVNTSSTSVLFVRQLSTAPTGTLSGASSVVEGDVPPGDQSCTTSADGAETICTPEG